MLPVHGTTQPLVRADMVEGEENTRGVKSLSAPTSLNSPDQPQLAAPCFALSACLSQAIGVHVPSAPASIPLPIYTMCPVPLPVPLWGLSCSKPWPKGRLPTLILDLLCYRGLAWWLWLWHEPGCHPCASPILLIQVMWGGPWLVRNVLAVTRGLWFPIPGPQPSPHCSLTLGCFYSLEGSNGPSAFPPGQRILSLVGLSIFFCVSKGSVCLRNCHTLGIFLRDATDLSISLSAIMGP